MNCLKDVKGEMNIFLMFYEHGRTISNDTKDDVADLSSPSPMDSSLGIMPSGWIPCSRQYSSLKLLARFVQSSFKDSNYKL